MDEQPSEAGEGRRLSEFEQEALFQEWVQKSLGTNPDKMDDDAYSTSFETFKTHMFRGRPEAPPLNPSRRSEQPRVVPEEAEAPLVTDARVKELYRALVRRLHPDLRADGNAAVSALWHEVQEAYAASDVARMELLLALSDLESSQVGEQTSLFQMRSVAFELQRAWRALEKSVQEAQGEDAWNFARTGADEDLRAAGAAATEVGSCGAHSASQFAHEHHCDLGTWREHESQSRAGCAAVRLRRHLAILAMLKSNNLVTIAGCASLDGYIRGQERRHKEYEPRFRVGRLTSIAERVAA
jgi:hypothetical protein